MLLLPLLLISLFYSSCLADVICNNGFSLVNSNKCLQLFTSPVKHRTAEATCNSFGGALVTIRNAIDNRAIQTFAANAGTNVWIGTYCFESNNPASCYFDDETGTASAYNNFARGFPNVDLGGCVYMAIAGGLAGQWVSGECEDVEMAFVCEIPTTKTDACIHNYNGFCYLPSQEITNTPSLPFNQAQDVCKQNCGSLASLLDKREINFATNIFSTLNVSSVTIGALAALPQLPYWIDGSRWGFSHISPFSGSTGSCFFMEVSSDSTWYQYTCQTSKYFLCKRPTGITCASTPAPPVIVTPAPTNPSWCNATVLMSPGTITSPNYPASYGTTFRYCVYKLATLGSGRISLYFTEISTAGNYDYVRVYDSNGAALGSYTGSPGTKKLVSTGNTMTVSFTASGSYSGYRGFSANFLAF